MEEERHRKKAFEEAVSHLHEEENTKSSEPGVGGSGN